MNLRFASRLRWKKLSLCQDWWLWRNLSSPSRVASRRQFFFKQVVKLHQVAHANPQLLQTAFDCLKSTWPITPRWHMQYIKYQQGHIKPASHPGWFIVFLNENHGSVDGVALKLEATFSDPPSKTRPNGWGYRFWFLGVPIFVETDLRDDHRSENDFRSGKNHRPNQTLVGSRISILCLWHLGSSDQWNWTASHKRNGGHFWCPWMISCRLVSHPFYTNQSIGFPVWQMVMLPYHFTIVVSVGQYSQTCSNYDWLLFTQYLREDSLHWNSSHFDTWHSRDSWPSRQPPSLVDIGWLSPWEESAKPGTTSLMAISMAI